MAITTVQGTITRTFFDGKGAEVTESWLSQGETRTKRWSAFFDDPHGLVEGDVVEVSGMHADKVDEWSKDGEKRHSVKRTLNKARWKSGDGAQQPATAPPAAQQRQIDPWEVAPIPDGPESSWDHTGKEPF